MIIPVEVVFVAAAAIMVVFMIIVITLWVKLNKLRKKYMAMLNGTGSMNMEEIIIDLQQKCNDLKRSSEAADQTVQRIREHLNRMKSHVGIYRYNAFAESGSDLSFSVAFVDEQKNGVVLSGIHNREQTYVYAKPIEQGQSKYTLSPEEKEAINRSLLKE